MKGMILALAVGGSLALYAVSPAVADEPVTPAKPTITTGGPVVVSDTVTGTTARRGLIARLRDRRSTGAVMTAPTTTVAPIAPAPSTTVPSPMPMPTVKPASGTTTTTPMVTTAAYTTTQPARTGLFSRLRNRGTTTTVEPMTMPMSAVVPASGTVTMPMTTTTEATTTTRMGPLARLRARR